MISALRLLAILFWSLVCADIGCAQGSTDESAPASDSTQPTTATFLILDIQRDSVKEDRERLERNISLLKTIQAQLRGSSASEFMEASVGELVEFATLLAVPDENDKQKRLDAIQKIGDFVDGIRYSFFRPFQYKDTFPLTIETRDEGEVTFSGPKELFVRFDISESELPAPASQGFLFLSSPGNLPSEPEGHKAAHEHCRGFANALPDADIKTVQQLDASSFSEQVFVDTLGKCKSNIGIITEYLKKVGDYYKKQEVALQEVFKHIEQSLNSRYQKNNEELKAVEQKLNDALTKAGLEEQKGIPSSAVAVIKYTLIGWGAIVVAVVIAILVLAYLSYRRVSSRAGEIADAPGNDFSFLLLLEMMTVFLLTGAILILGLGSKLDNQGLAALIGGISGYVLGRMRNVTPSNAKGN